MYAKSMFFNNIPSLLSSFPTHPYRTAPTPHPALVGCNMQPVGITSCQGLQAGAGVNNNPELPDINCGNRSQPITEMANPCSNQYVSRIFVVPKKDGSFRPVINQKPLNWFIVAAHFKMEGLAMLKDLLRPGDWMASIDLKDAYLSVSIWEEHRKYLLEQPTA